MDDFSGISDRLRTAIDNKGLTQVQVANMIGISKHSVTKYLNGRIPEAIILYKLSQLLDVSMEWLLTGRDGTIDTQKKQVEPIDPDLFDEPSFRMWIETLKNLSPETRTVLFKVMSQYLPNSEETAAGLMPDDLIDVQKKPRRNLA